jgi:hypothetical protein
VGRGWGRSGAEKTGLDCESPMQPPTFFWSWVSFQRQPGFDSARGILTLPTLVHVQYLESMDSTRKLAHRAACSRR